MLQRQLVVPFHQLVWSHQNTCALNSGLMTLTTLNPGLDPIHVGSGINTVQSAWIKSSKLNNPKCDIIMSFGLLWSTLVVVFTPGLSSTIFKKGVKLWSLLALWHLQRSLNSTWFCWWWNIFALQPLTHPDSRPSGTMPLVLSTLPLWSQLSLSIHSSSCLSLGTLHAIFMTFLQIPYNLPFTTLLASSCYHSWPCVSFLCHPPSTLSYVLFPASYDTIVSSLHLLAEFLVPSSSKHFSGPWTEAHLSHSPQLHPPASFFFKNLYFISLSRLASVWTDWLVVYYTGS